jgi:hypothetical protein
MKSGLPWQVSGVRREVRDTAREAARRAGMSVGEWLDSVILESAQAGEGQHPGEAEQPGEAQLYRRRARDRDPQADERRHDYGRRFVDERYGEDAVKSFQDHDWPPEYRDARQHRFDEREDPGRTRRASAARRERVPGNAGGARWSQCAARPARRAAQQSSANQCGQRSGPPP